MQLPGTSALQQQLANRTAADILKGERGMGWGGCRVALVGSNYQVLEHS